MTLVYHQLIVPRRYLEDVIISDEFAMTVNSYESHQAVYWHIEWPMLHWIIKLYLVALMLANVELNEMRWCLPFLAHWCIIKDGSDNSLRQQDLKKKF